MVRDKRYRRPGWSVSTCVVKRELVYLTPRISKGSDSWPMISIESVFGRPRWVETKNMGKGSKSKAGTILPAIPKNTGFEPSFLKLTTTEPRNSPFSLGFSRRTVTLPLLPGGTRTGMLVTTRGGVSCTSLIASASKPLFSKRKVCCHSSVIPISPKSNISG